MITATLGAASAAPASTRATAATANPAQYRSFRSWSCPSLSRIPPGWLAAWRSAIRPSSPHAEKYRRWGKQKAKRGRVGERLAAGHVDRHRHRHDRGQGGPGRLDGGDSAGLRAGLSDGAPASRPGSSRTPPTGSPACLPRSPTSRADDLRGLLGIGLPAGEYPRLRRRRLRAASPGDRLAGRALRRGCRGARRPVSREEKTAWFGGPMPIDASHALSRMARVARVHPEPYARTAPCWCPRISARDSPVASPVIRSLPSLSSTAGLPISRPDRACARRCREAAAAPRPADGRLVRPGLPCAGAPCRRDDGCLGGDVRRRRDRRRDAMYLSGTSEVLGLISPVRVPTPGVIVFPARAHRCTPRRPRRAARRSTGCRPSSAATPARFGPRGWRRRPDSSAFPAAPRRLSGRRSGTPRRAAPSPG